MESKSKKSAKTQLGAHTNTTQLYAREVLGAEPQLLNAAEEVRFTYGELGACLGTHVEPLYGCPVCFLKLAFPALTPQGLVVQHLAAEEGGAK